MREWGIVGTAGWRVNANGSDSIRVFVSDIDALQLPTKMLPPHALRQHARGLTRAAQTMGPLRIMQRQQQVFCLLPTASIQQDNKATYE